MSDHAIWVLFDMQNFVVKYRIAHCVFLDGCKYIKIFMCSPHTFSSQYFLFLANNLCELVFIYFEYIISLHWSLRGIYKIHIPIYLYTIHTQKIKDACEYIFRTETSIKYTNKILLKYIWEKSRTLYEPHITTLNCCSFPNI